MNKKIRIKFILKNIVQSFNNIEKIRYFDCLLRGKSKINASSIETNVYGSHAYAMRLTSYVLPSNSVAGI